MTIFEIDAVKSLLVILFLSKGLKNSRVFATVLTNTQDIIDKIVQSVKPQQLAIFSNNFSKQINSHQNCYLKGLINRATSFIINLPELKTTNKSDVLKLPVFCYPRSSLTYAVFITDVECNGTRNILDELSGIAPVPTKPKFLLIVHGKKMLLRHRLEEILLYAWSLKFLDFTILQIMESAEVFYSTYNPIRNNYLMKYLESDDEIFPNKLKHLNLYPIKTFLFNSPPLIVVKKVKNKIDIMGNSYAIFNALVQTMNMSTHYTLDLQYNLTKALENLFYKLENNEIQMSVLSGLLSKYLLSKKIVTGYPTMYSRLVLIVPVTAAPIVHYSPIFQGLLGIFVIAVIFTLNSYLMKFSSEYKNFMTIIQIVIGVPIFRFPTQMRERIMFCTIAFISMQYSGNVFSKITDLTLSSETLRYDTLEDIFESKLTVYTYDVPNKYDNEAIQQLFKISKKVKNVSDCINILLKTGSACCLTTLNVAKHFVQAHVDSNYSPLMKIAEVKFPLDLVSFAYEKSSPFVERFDGVLQRFLQAGIVNRLKVNKPSFKIHSTTRLNISQNKLSLCLVQFLTAGFMAAFSIFIFELMLNRNYGCIFIEATRPVCSD